MVGIVIGIFRVVTSRIVPTNQPLTYVNTVVKGTFGYLDPNYFHTGRLTRKSDVYAFGVILFELLCGRKALDISLDEEEMGLATWAQDSIKEGTLKQIVDSNLRGAMSSKCMKEFVVLANRCLDSNPKKRPTMSELVAGLESILALHEKTNGTLLPMDKKIFGIKVAAAFRLPSSHEKSVVARSLKSMESYLHTVGGENQILRRFDFKTINDATDNFSRSNMIAYDIYPTHKGILQNGQHITIVGPYSHHDYDRCMNAVSLHVKVEHHNLVHLLGWCIEATNVYLVYDYSHNYTTLNHRLSDHNRAPLEWDERYKILLGVARVLLYLHKHASIRVILCNVNPGKILLDEGLDPKLYDFDCAVSTTINEIDYIESNVISGTYGYMAPEYAIHGHPSTKADVFSFGMTVLETIVGRRIRVMKAIVGRSMSSSNEFTRISVDYIWRNWVDGTYSNITDTTRLSVDSRSITRFIHIGLLCIQKEATDRPTMEEVVTMLLGNSSISLPVLKKPTYVLEDYVDPGSCSSTYLFEDYGDYDMRSEADYESRSVGDLSDSDIVSPR